MKKLLMLMGAELLLSNAVTYLEAVEPRWFYPEIDKDGYYTDGQDAMDILKATRRMVHHDIERERLK